MYMFVYIWKIIQMRERINFSFSFWSDFTLPPITTRPRVLKFLRPTYICVLL